MVPSNTYSYPNDVSVNLQEMSARTNLEQRAAQALEPEAAPAPAPEAAPTREDTETRQRPSPRRPVRSMEEFTFKRYPGDEQVEMHVRIEVPGSWFGDGANGSLSAGERREKYEAVAVEYDPNHVFKGTTKGRKTARQAEAIRFICHDDAADEADHPGYWMRLDAWNRYRNDTYRNRREDEQQYIKDDAERAPAAVAAPGVCAVGEKDRPPVYDFFTFVESGMHEMRLDDGTVKIIPCEWWECKKKNKGCRVKGGELIKVVKKATGGLLRHLKRCEGEATWLKVRAVSMRSKVALGIDGKILVSRMSFIEVLPHHVRFVIFCFSHWKHFSMTRAKEFREYITGIDLRAGVPARETCIKIIYVIQHLLHDNLVKLLATMKETFGSPFFGFLDDIWSKRRCRQSFACARLALAIDGDLLDSFGQTQKPESVTKTYSGRIVKASPVLDFSTLSSSRHSGKVIALWKERALQKVNCVIKDIR